MTKGEYLEAHHQITETQIGLARMHLSVGRADKAEEALDACSVQLKEIFKDRAESLGVDLAMLGSHWV